MTNETSGISRRTLAKGAAWAVPAVAVAAARPAMASSAGSSGHRSGTPASSPGDSCAPEFSKGYTFTVRLYNPTGETVYVYLSPSGDYQPYFQYTSGVQFTFGSAREYFPGSPDTLGTLQNPLVLTAGKTRYIAVDGGAAARARTLTPGASCWFAWGRHLREGGDPDRPYTAQPLGHSAGDSLEGWIGGEFRSPRVARPRPCDKKNNCTPTQLRSSAHSEARRRPPGLHSFRTRLELWEGIGCRPLTPRCVRISWPCVRISWFRRRSFTPVIRLYGHPWAPTSSVAVRVGRRPRLPALRGSADSPTSAGSTGSISGRTRRSPRLAVILAGGLILTACASGAQLSVSTAPVPSPPPRSWGRWSATSPPAPGRPRR